MSCNISTSLPMTTVGDTSDFPTIKINGNQAVTVTYDYFVDWIQGEWAGTKSMGWFSYTDSSPCPFLQTFSLMTGGTQPRMTSYSPFRKPPLYWDGTKLAIREWWGVPPHVFLSEKRRLFSHSSEGYYLSFAETASDYLINVYASDRYTYMGGGRVTYKKRSLL